jgi:hypothetical protein
VNLKSANAEASIATFKSCDRRPPNVRSTLRAPPRGLKAQVADYMEITRSVMDEW